MAEAYNPNSLQPTRDLDIRGGVIHYHLYDQTDKLVPASCEDTVSNRLFVVWCRKFDSIHALTPERRNGQSFFKTPNTEDAPNG